MSYAKNTKVSPSRSREEVEKLLVRYGATGYMYAWQEDQGDEGRALIQFKMNNRMLRFVLTMPAKSERRFTHTDSWGHERAQDVALYLWEQACRASWRSLVLIIKAKLEAVEIGIVTFEEEFLSYIVMPNGQTVGEATAPAIEEAYENGLMPSTILALPQGPTP